MKIRPQVLSAMIALTVIAVVSLYLSYEQVALLAVGAIAPITMKLLENE